MSQEMNSESKQLPSHATGHGGGVPAQNIEQEAATRRCSFRARRRLITSSEVMRMTPNTNHDELAAPGSFSTEVEPTVCHDFVETKAENRIVAPFGEEDREHVTDKVEDNSLLTEQTPTTLQVRSGTSSGYFSYGSSGVSKTFMKPKTPKKAQKGNDLISLRERVQVLRNNFGVLKLLLSQLSFDFESAGESCSA